MALVFNSYFLIQIPHDKRIFGLSASFLFSYVALAAAMINQESPMSMLYVLVACITHSFAKTLGEACILGYLKAIPQEMVVTFSSGTGASIFFTSFSTLFFQEFGLD